MTMWRVLWQIPTYKSDKSKVDISYLHIRTARQDYCDSVCQAVALKASHSLLTAACDSKLFHVLYLYFDQATSSMQKNKHIGSILRNACVACETAMSDYQESVTTGLTDRQTDARQTDAGQGDPFVRLCFAGDTKYCKRGNFSWE